MNCTECGNKLLPTDSAILVVEAVVSKNSYLTKRIVRAYCEKCGKATIKKLESPR